MSILHGIHEREWVPVECTLKLLHPFKFEAVFPTWVAALMARCDGTATLREHLEFFQQSGALRPDTPPLEFARYIATMVGAGLIEIEDFPIPGERRPTVRPEA